MIENDVMIEDDVMIEAGTAPGRYPRERDASSTGECCYWVGSCRPPIRAFWN